MLFDAPPQRCAWGRECAPLVVVAAHGPLGAVPGPAPSCFDHIAPKRASVRPLPSTPQVWVATLVTVFASGAVIWALDVWSTVGQEQEEEADHVRGPTLFACGMCIAWA